MPKVLSGLITWGVSQNEYQGAYYKSSTYTSGRRLKVVLTTYENSNYTGFVKQYINYIKW